MACYARWQTTIGGQVKQLACGQCIGCRLEYSRQWAIRCMNEAQLYEHNAYITLTYEEQPPDNNLAYGDWQVFMRKLRKHVERRDLQSKEKPTKGRARGHVPHNQKAGINIPDKNNKIRFYMSGEYGEKHGRPHFHALIFNVEFNDKVYLKKSPGGEKLYTSATLTKLWGKGFASIGDVTFKSAAYVARYVLKKKYGAQAPEKYQFTDKKTGEIKNRKTEFSNMSRKPGIGMPWIKKYTSDVYPDGMMVVNGHRVRPPKAYDRYYKLKNPRRYLTMTQKREKEGRDNIADNTNERLEAKQTVKEAQLKQLKRKL